jgi:hypothetical protein
MRLVQTDWTTMWRQVNADMKDASRAGRAA